MAGLVVAEVFWLQVVGLGSILTGLLFVAVPAVIAYLAVRYGDTFWERWIRGDF